jgi:SHS2 domain-containing protein
MAGERYRVLDHHADLYLEISGETLEDLFRNAAYALACEMVDGPLPEPTLAPRHVALEPAQPELLLRAWLAELLFLSETERELYTEWHPAVTEGGGLEASVRGVPLESVAERLSGEIKAVTYHGLLVERTPAGYRAEVILDL